MGKYDDSGGADRTVEADEIVYAERPNGLTQREEALYRIIMLTLYVAAKAVIVLAAVFLYIFLNILSWSNEKGEEGADRGEPERCDDYGAHCRPVVIYIQSGTDTDTQDLDQ